MSSAAARRHYVTVGARQVRLSRAGDGPALVVLPPAPRSSAAQATLIGALAARFTVIAPELPGYGGSDPLPCSGPEVPDYADAVAAALTALGVGRFALYGEGAGASIALELARRHGERVAAISLDGLALDGAAERRELLARGWPPIEPMIDGTHLVAAWTRHRDGFLFRPWYRREAAARRHIEMPDPCALHEGVVEVLRAGPAYGAAPQAALRHDAAAALAAVATPLLRLDSAGDDDSPSATAAILADFLAEHADGVTPPPAPRPAAAGGAISRDFVTTSFGQLHLRRAGGADGTPLVMLHASPGSAQILVPLIELLATEQRPVLAFDTIGNGDSDKPPWQAAEIGDYAPVVLAALDALGLDTVDLYGTHTGAKIALETCVLAPARVRRLVLDGLAIYDPAQRDELLARYTPAFVPRDDGAHLVAAWSFLRDQTLFWPWFNRTPAGIRAVEPIGAAALHEWLLELLASGSTYSIGYRAAFRHATRARLPLLATPALFAARGSDAIHASTIAAAALAQHATASTLPEDDAAAARAIAEFLDA